MGLADAIAGALAFLGPVGTPLALYLIFVLDAALFPALPEVFIALFLAVPPAGTPLALWALALLATAVAGEATGNALLYLVVRRVFVARGRWPRFLEKVMRRWTQFLVVKDERIILVNRVAPVVPLVGMFIAVLGWDFRRSLLYVVVGAAAKYAVLLALLATILVAYPREIAEWITITAVLVVVAVSAVTSLLYRRRLKVGAAPASRDAK
jgi:membrane protein YqaA with SNARE-associated domain